MSQDPGQVSTRRVHSGRVVKLDIDTVRYPDGTIGELEMVRHRGASAVLPLLGTLGSADPALLLVRQYRYAAGDYIYEIPAGLLEPGEDPESCARRELKEEVGCEAAEFRHLTSIFTTPGFTDERIHLYLATELTRGDTAHEQDEFMTVETVPMSHALQLIRDGGIVDSKTVVALLYVAGFLGG
jgi:ADP-ribose pyrophosphatase